MARKVQGVVCPNCGSTLYSNVEGVSGDNIVVCRDESEDPPTGCQAAWDLDALKAAGEADANTGPVQEAEAAPDVGPSPPTAEEEPAPEPTPAEAGENADAEPAVEATS